MSSSAGIIFWLCGPIRRVSFMLLRQFLPGNKRVKIYCNRLMNFLLQEVVVAKSDSKVMEINYCEQPWMKAMWCLLVFSLAKQNVQYCVNNKWTLSAGLCFVLLCVAWTWYLCVRSGSSGVSWLNRAAAARLKGGQVPPVVYGLRSWHLSGISRTRSECRTRVLR